MYEEMQPKRRRERKKKQLGEWDLPGQERQVSHKRHITEADEYDNEEGDVDTKEEYIERDISHHHSTTGWSTTIIFVITSTALAVLIGIIFFELKGSQQVGTPIEESRYVNILRNFVEEVTDADDHVLPSHSEHDESDDAEADPSDIPEEEVHTDPGPPSSVEEEVHTDPGPFSIVEDEEAAQPPHEKEEEKSDVPETSENIEEVAAEDPVQSPEDPYQEGNREEVIEEQQQVPGPEIYQQYYAYSEPVLDIDSPQQPVLREEDEVITSPDDSVPEEPENEETENETGEVEDNAEDGVEEAEDPQESDTSDITNEYDSQIIRELHEAEIELDRELHNF